MGETSVMCPSCGKQNADDTKFCNFCGKPLVTPKESRKCPSCGKENASYVMYCGNCGSELPTVFVEHKPEAVAVPTSPAPSTSATPAPSTFTTNAYWERELETDFHQPQRTSGPTAAGIMMILAGVIAIGMGLLYLIAGASYVPESPAGVNVQGIIGCCGALELMFGLGSAAGGLFAIQRKHFVLALLGSIVGLLTIGPLFIGSILSLISLILLAMAHEEFE